VASIFASALLRGARPAVFEDGAQLRDFIHVTDVARANLLALERDDPEPAAYNVASGRPRTVLDLARELARALDREDLAPDVTGQWRGGDVRHVFASPQLARDLLGFSAEVSFEDGVAELAGGASAAATIPSAGGVSP
jgi:dTDP-L-rhamnose 4-epimerase